MCGTKTRVLGSCNSNQVSSCCEVTVLTEATCCLHNVVCKCSFYSSWAESTILIFLEAIGAKNVVWRSLSWRKGHGIVSMKKGQSSVEHSIEICEWPSSQRRAHWVFRKKQQSVCYIVIAHLAKSLQVKISQLANAGTFTKIYIDIHGKSETTRKVSGSQ